MRKIRLSRVKSAPYENASALAAFKQMTFGRIEMRRCQRSGQRFVGSVR